MVRLGVRAAGLAVAAVLLVLCLPAAAMAAGTWSGPVPADPSLPGSASVSCPSQSFCVTVSGGGQAAAYENGSWSQPIVIDPDHNLNSVSCPSESFCVAVDGYGNVVTYSNGTWGQPVNLEGNDGAGFFYVSCGSSSFCMALDSNYDVLTYSDGTWSTPAQIDGTNLTRLSCAPGTTFCLATGLSNTYVTFDNGTWSAVGDVGSGPIDSLSCPSDSYCVATERAGNVLTFSNGSWSAPTSIDSSDNSLWSVSCSSSSFCGAVDESGNVFTYQNGSWSGPTAADPNSGFYTISCPVDGFCMAADYNHSYTTFASGSWSPLTSIDTSQGLNSVSCATPTFCVASDPNGDVTTYDGSAWSPPTTVDGAGLLAVSCASSSFCVGVDGTGSEATFSNGSWATPVDIDGTTQLNAVSCAPSTTFCVAVDQNGDVVTFDNGSWGTPTNVDANALTTISCPSSSFCVAGDAAGNEVTFSNGNWSSPQDVDSTDYVNSVSCASAMFCVLVDENGHAVTFSGGTWGTPVAVPEAPVAISCPLTTTCLEIATNTSDASGGVSTYQIRHNGSWSTPIGFDPDAGADDVSCPTAWFCVAVDPYGYASTYFNPPPQNQTLPVIAGTAQDGQTLTTSTGKWTSSDTVTYSYQWQRCPSGGVCSNITGATKSSFKLTSADVGDDVTVVVTATDQEKHAASATAQPVGAVAPPAPPQVKTLPTISGTLQDGQTIKATSGTWSSPDKLTFVYQWQRCVSGGSCSNVGSPTKTNTYKLTSADVGDTIAVVVTATDAEQQTGQASASSAGTVAAPPPPVNTKIPVITGTLAVGKTLKSNTGSWSSPDKLTFVYQWQRCVSGGSCSNVGNPTKTNTYMLTSSDSGSDITVTVIATDAEGQTGQGTATPVGPIS